MMAAGVSVRVWCDRCTAPFREVDLEAVAAKLGGDYDLWGKWTPCRLTEGCEGRNRFYHDGRGHFMKLRD